MLRVAISTSATVALAFEVARLLQLRDDALRRTLGDADQVRHLTQPHIGVLGDAQEHVRVIGEEGPLGHASIVHRRHLIPPT